MGDSPDCHYRATGYSATERRVGRLRGLGPAIRNQFHLPLPRGLGSRKIRLSQSHIDQEFDGPGRQGYVRAEARPIWYPNRCRSLAVLRISAAGKLSRLAKTHKPGFSRFSTPARPMRENRTRPGRLVFICGLEDLNDELGWLSPYKFPAYRIPLRWNAPPRKMYAPRARACYRKAPENAANNC